MPVFASWVGAAQGSGSSEERVSRWPSLRTAWTSVIQRLELRSWRRRVQREEAYLAQAVDADDLDRRMRILDCQERTRFIGYF